MKNAYIYISVFILVLAGVVFLGVKNQKSTVVVSPIVMEQASSTHAEIQMYYPKSDATHLSEIWNDVKKNKVDFLTNYGQITDKEILDQYGRSDVQFQFFVSTKIATSSKTVSYIISTYEFTGGAHGGMGVKTYTYDQKGKLINIEDVLGKDYMKTVAPLSKEFFYNTLGSSSEKSMVDDGTSEKKENFSSWYLTDKLIVFIFGQYQVGPYVLGIQEFPIEKSRVTVILNPEYK